MKISAGNDQIARVAPILKALRAAYPRLEPELDDTIAKAKNGLTIRVEPLEYNQTDSQRGYYHKWKNEFAKHCGNTPDEMHEYLLGEAYGTELVETRIGVRRRPMKRSSTAKRTDYSLLIDTLIQVAAEMGFHVPPPM